MIDYEAAAGVMNSQATCCYVVSCGMLGTAVNSLLSLNQKEEDILAAVHHCIAVFRSSSPKTNPHDD